jgi:hypothetical protein
MDPALRLLRNYAVALAVAGFLIWIPFFGMFLTFATGGMLISFICNIFLIHLTFVACARRTSLGWLMAPLVCYGLWLVWVVVQNHPIAAEKDRLESENRLTGDIPSNLTLVFSKNDIDLARRAKLHLASSVRVFVDTVELSTMPPRKIGCLLPRPNDTPFIQKTRCPTEPNAQIPADAIVFRELERPNPQSRTYLHRYALTQSSAAGDRTVGHLNFGRLTAPVWAPVFLAGCFLIDQPAAWACHMSPKYRDIAIGETGLGSYGDISHRYSDPVVATLAKMLGVKFIVEERPRPQSPETPQTKSTPAPPVSDPNDMGRYKD